jgi:GGDEF domain-containing protein
MLHARVRAWLARYASAGAMSRAELSRVTDSQPNLEAIVRSVPLFQSLEPLQLERMLAKAVERTYPAGQTVIQQGEPGRAVYVIISGRVRIVEAVMDSTVDMLLGELGTGEVFGELGVLGERPCSASILTLETTRCLIFPRDQFLEGLRDSSEMSMVLLKTLAKRLFEADRLLARHAPDPLTGLPGRRGFYDVIRLKAINDRFGYNVGDDVLRSVADALVDSVRTSDMAARYGGDEFVVLFAESNGQDCDAVFKRFHGKLSEIGSSRGLPLPVECSFGFAVSDNPADSPDPLLRAADQDMQRRFRVLP